MSEWQAGKKLLDDAGEVVRRLILDNVYKVSRSHPHAVPPAREGYLYHITTPKSAKSIVSSGAIRPGDGSKWGGGITPLGMHSKGKVFLGDAASADNWQWMIGDALDASMDDAPEKLAVMQFRNPLQPMNEDSVRAIRALVRSPEAKLLDAMYWRAENDAKFPRIFPDALGIRDTTGLSYYLDGEVPVVSSPRVRRITSAYGLAPATLGAEGLVSQQQGAESKAPAF